MRGRSFGGFGLILLFYAAATLLAGGNRHQVVAQSSSLCGLAQPALCDTFDQPMGNGGRMGALNPIVWGVSRVGNTMDASHYDDTWPAHLTVCGTTQQVQPENDIAICNGQLAEASDDGGNLSPSGGGVTTLAMYPKQPFDFAGRTGKVTFDVSNDSQGSHAAWPEFWLTDKPVPAPFTHEFTWIAYPQNGFGIRFAGCTDSSGSGATCPSSDPANCLGVDSAVIIRNYVGDDTFTGGTTNSEETSTIKVVGDGCVVRSTAGQLNHYEIDVSQSRIDIYGTDAFAGPLNLAATPLRHIAAIPNANLTFTRGLIWLEDAHYNACKFNSQCDHTFIWDNAGFDGPILARDIGYSVPDALVPESDGSVRLGWNVPANAPKTVSIDIDGTALTQAAAALLEFNFYHTTAPISLLYSANGNATHTQLWPYLGNSTYTPRTIALPVPLSELHAGTNTLSISGSDTLVIANVDLILAGAGGVPNCIDPSACGSLPSPTPNPSPTPTPSPTPQPLPPPSPSPASGSGCLFENGALPAFCEDFSGGPNNGGRSGDLNAARWSVGRYGPQNNPGVMSFPSTPVQPCKAGVSNVAPDDDILVCDGASGHVGQIETALSAQNYASLSMRPRQAFNFQGRTGTIAFNVSGVSVGNSSWWPSVYLTDTPQPVAGDTNQVMGMVPVNGVGINFDDGCGAQDDAASVTGMGLENFTGAFAWNNYAETNLALGNGVCVKAKVGFLNHVEIRLSQSHVEVWASDYSTDGVTFPNFQLIGSGALNLPFSQGYVLFQTQERAPIKYSKIPPYANYYWSGLGFDGPVVAQEAGYPIAEPLTVQSDGSYQIAFPMNTATPTGPFSFSNVNLTGAGQARLSFSIAYTFPSPSMGPSNIGEKYSLNGGPFQTPIVLPNYVAATNCNSCPGPSPENWAIAFSFPISLSDLVPGANTLRLQTSGTSDSFPPMLGNIELITLGGAAPSPSPSPSPTATPSPSPSPSPTATPSPVPTVSCTVSVNKSNGKATSQGCAGLPGGSGSYSCPIAFPRAGGPITGSCQ